MRLGLSNSAAAWVASDSNSASSFQTLSWAGAPTQLVFVTAPQVIDDNPGTSGTITAQEQDGLGNPVSATAAVTVSLMSGSTNVTFSPSASVTIAAGQSTVSFTLSDTTDTIPETVTASATGMQTATQTESFNVSGTQATASVGSQSGALAPSGTATFSVTVNNCSGCNTHGYSITNVGGLPPGATWSASPSCASISGGSPTATFTVTVTTTTATPASATPYSMSVVATRWNDASDCNLSGGIYVLAEGTSSLTVDPGTTAKLAFSVQPDGATSSGGAFPVQPTVAVEDAYGNVVTSASASVTLALTGAGALGGCTSAVNTTGGVASFTSCHVTGTVDIVGDTLKATASRGFTGSVVSDPFDITGAASKLVFSTQPAGDSGTGSLSSQPVLTVEDSSSHAVTASSASITLAPSSNTLTCPRSGLTVAASYGSATFGACAITTAGSGYTLKATSGSLTSATSSSFNVTIAAPTITAPSSGTPQAFSFAASGSDGGTETETFTTTGTKLAYGATVAASGGDFTIDGWTWLSTTQISVTATCTAAVTDGLVVSDPDGGSVTASSSLSCTA